MKLTKSLPVIKERNCTASLVLDRRTQRRNATEFPLAMRFTIDRKFFYHVVGSSYTEKQFSDICNATKSSSDNYREQRMWRETIVLKYKDLLLELNKGDMLTFEMVRLAVTTGNPNIQEKDNRSFMSIWEQVIHDLKTNDNGARFTTGQNYESALHSFRAIMGDDAIKGFDINVTEIQKWKDGMKNGVVGKNGKLIGKICDTTIGIYLRAFRVAWNESVRQGFLKDVPYPFSNKKEKKLVSIPASAKRRKCYLRVNQMTELYNLFITKQYPEHWQESYKASVHFSLGLFLVHPQILSGAEDEENRRKRTQQENKNVRDRMDKVCHEVLHWDESIKPTNTWCRHSFGTNLHNAGVELDYISEAMGHSSGDHAITHIYLDTYPLEKQMEYNSLLLYLETDDSKRDRLEKELATLSESDLAQILNNLKQSN